MVYNINSNLGGLSFYEDATGKYVVGADSVPKKLGKGEIQSQLSASYDSTSFKYSTVATYNNLDGYDTLIIGSVTTEKFHDGSIVAYTSAGASKTLASVADYSYGSIAGTYNISGYVKVVITWRGRYSGTVYVSNIQIR